MSQRRPWQERVVAAAETALARQKFVTPIDVCLGIGWLQPPNLDDWRHGRVDDLDYFLPAHDDRSVAFLVHLAEWATAKGLKRVQADYVSATRSHRPLRFTSLDEPTIENAWRTHWISPDLPDEPAGRALDEQAITLAVRASIRHEDTDYDALLMSGVSREEARARTRPAIDRILTAWSEQG